VLENKKGAAELPRLPPKKAQKKAEYPYIGHSAVKKVRLPLNQVELFSGFIKRPAIVKRLDLPYIKVNFFVVLVNPARLSIDSPQPAGTIKRQRTSLAR
jgi:hypothetical protein